jgi:hypothetical protein
VESIIVDERFATPTNYSGYNNAHNHIGVFSNGATLNYYSTVMSKVTLTQNQLKINSALELSGNMGVFLIPLSFDFQVKVDTIYNPVAKSSTDVYSDSLISYIVSHLALETYTNANKIDVPTL